MNNEQIISIISEYSLTVRCLPYEVTELWSYREGDENVRRINSRGEDITSEYSVFIHPNGREY